MKITPTVLAATVLGFSVGAFATDSSGGGVAERAAADIGANPVSAGSDITSDQDRAGYFSYGLASVVAGVVIFTAGGLMWSRKNDEDMTGSRDPR